MVVTVTAAPTVSYPDGCVSVTFISELTLAAAAYVWCPNRAGWGRLWSAAPAGCSRV